MGLAVGLAVGSAALSAGGQLAGGIGARRAAKGQQRVGELNAFLAKQDAKAARAIAGERAIQIGRSAEAARASAVLERVARLGSGALYGGGSETDFLADLDAQAQFAIESTLAEGENTARSYLLEARSSRLQGAIGRQTANFQMGASIAGAASQFADTWRRFAPAGGGGGDGGGAWF